MNTVIIACETVENELRAAMKQAGCTHEVLYIESGLHNVPKHLRERLQETLDRVPEGTEAVLLAMGTCGNSVQGLKTGNYVLILPRVDDCISLMMGSMDARREAGRDGGTYFMTAGWLKGERHIGREYDYTMEKYGEETGRMIFDMMMGHYRRMALLDTGCFDADTARTEVQQIAEKLGLEYGELPGTVGYLKELLTGPWDEDRFIITPPNSELTDVTV